MSKSERASAANPKNGSGKLETPGAPEMLPTAASAAAPRISAPRAFVCAAVALGLGCATTAWIAKSRYEKFTGYLQARTHTIAFDREARLSQILVRQGEGVSAGQPLITLEDAQLLRQIRQQEQLVKALDAEVVQTEARTQIELDRERNRIDREIFDTRQNTADLLMQRFKVELDEVAFVEVGVRPGALAFVESSIEDVISEHPQIRNLPKPMVLQDAVPTDEHIRNKLRGQKIRNVKETLTARIEMCEQHLTELTRISKELPDKIRRATGLNIVQARLDDAKAELTMLEQRRQALTINAPGTGQVGVYRKHVGEHIAPHEPIVQVIDGDQPHLLLQIPSSRVADFPAGKTVELTFPGDVRRKGRVAEVPPQTANAPGITTAETQMAVQIAPAGLLWPNPPYGTMVEVRRPR